MNDERIKQIREYVWTKYIDNGHADEINEEDALLALQAYHEEHPVSIDGETFYLGILYFELAWLQEDEKQRLLYFGHSKRILERYVERSGDSEWEPVALRIEDANGALEELDEATRAKLVAQIDSELDARDSTAAEYSTQTAQPDIVDGMVLVSAGAFPSGPENTSRETKAFWIDVDPVTNAQYEEFVLATRYRSPKFWTEGRLNDPDAPVVGISWFDAFKYAAFVGKSLPSKDQWEKAARGPEGHVYPWGSEFDAERANHGKPDGSDGVENVHQRPENVSPYGVRGMCGNVWEWTDSPDPNDSEQKVICGGSWVDDAEFLRCDQHLAAYPKDKYDNIGFRCVRLQRD